MKLIKILLSEGRKETLIKKYEEKFGVNLTHVLNDELSKSTNYKYVDWILSKSPEGVQQLPYIDKSLRLLKIFDKINSNLEKKDINQYSSLDELESAIEKYQSEKGPNPDVEKIYEDEKFLVVIPKNEEASCKYGSNTKWCITQRDSGHYQRYTKGNQALYFIINKANSTNKDYSKIAVHFNDSGVERWYDSKDVSMSDREKEIMYYAFPEMISKIKENYKKISKNIYKASLYQIFNDKRFYAKDINNFLRTNKNIRVLVGNFETVPDLGDGHAIGSIDIILFNNGVSEKIDSYELFMIFGQKNDNFFLDVGFQGNEPDEDVEFVDLGLENESIKLRYSADRIPYIYKSETIKSFIANQVIENIINNEKLLEKVVGKSSVWRPNITYGYTFKNNKGLIKKLVDYLDEGNRGTKLDFLVHIGKLKEKIENGKKYYSHINTNHYLPSKDFRGHFSSFFASAKNAGIINYDKSGRNNYMRKGRNFNNFKEGKLTAV